MGRGGGGREREILLDRAVYSPRLGRGPLGPVPNAVCIIIVWWHVLCCWALPQVSLVASGVAVTEMV